MTPQVSMRDALEDPQLLGNALPGGSHRLWRILLIAICGEALTNEERLEFKAVTGRDHEPGIPVEEFWGVIGRRGGKTKAMACLAVYLGALCDYSDVLPEGERGVIPIMAASTWQAKTALMHITAILGRSPILCNSIDGESNEEIRLNTRIDIAVRPANFKTIRSITAVAAIGDEVAFWALDGSANPDTEILTAIRPALATTGGPLIVISSPYARRGELWQTYRKHFGPDGDPLILVAQGASTTFNPSLPQKVVDRAMERDESAARAEYLGEFRTDIEALLTQEALDAVTLSGVRERAREIGRTYVGFVDPSGGSADSFTLAIAHKEGVRVFLDVLRECKPPFSPEGVVIEYVSVLKTYGIHKVYGDRYAGEWPREQFKKHGIAYEVADRSKSEIYRDLVPVVNSGQCGLLDNDRLQKQLISLERRTARGGRDSIDHPPNGHDDLANVAAGVVVYSVNASTYTLSNI